MEMLFAFLLALWIEGAGVVDNPTSPIEVSAQDGGSGPPPPPGGGNP